MPKKAESKKVLDGRAEVCSYARKPQVYFLRIFRPEKKGYDSLRIEGAVSLADAETKALETYISLSKAEKPVREVIREPRGTSGSMITSSSQRIPKVLIVDAVAQFNKEQLERVEAGMIVPMTAKKTEIVLVNHFIPYCQKYGIVSTRDIKLDSLDKFPVFVPVESRVTIKAYLVVIGQFLKHLSRSRLLDPYVAGLIGEILPTVKTGQEDFMANPPFRPEDWFIYHTELKRWKDEAEKQVPQDSRQLYHRRKFWCLVMFLHQTGLRPAEALSLRWKDIETVDIGRFSETQYKKDVLQNEEDLLQIEQEGIGEVIWDEENENDFGKVSRFITHIRVLHSKTRAVREVSSNSAETLARLEEFQDERVAYLNKKYDRELTREPDTLIFDSPMDGEWRSQGYSNYTMAWNNVLRRCKGIKGPVLSEKKYTMYSLRSSRAQWMLEQGVDLAVAAKQLGHSPQMLLSTYARLPVREQAIKQAAHIEYGKRKKEEKVVELSEVNRKQ